MFALRIDIIGVKSVVIQSNRSIPIENSASLKSWQQVMIYFFAHYFDEHFNHDHVFAGSRIKLTSLGLQQARAGSSENHFAESGCFSRIETILSCP